MTSGPQDPQHGGHGQQSPQGGPPQYGQDPQYGQGGPQYGAQSPWGQGGPEQPGPPAYPAAPGAQYGGAPAAPTERPTTVKAGIGAFLANTLLGLIASIITFTSLDSQIDDLVVDQALTRDEASAALTIGAVIGLILTAAYLLVLFFAWKGHNWARIVLWVLGGLSVLFSLLGASALGFLGVLGLLLTIAGIVLLALKPSSEWYRAETRRRNQF
ncbi:hypothetical protein [Modestobacter sp. VKM Ac-2984]|uniref:hypothetical protein n=1 Tax=Modestobacter sp. VKM Ac-2984 TaxID=3004138 RepID=UPI0022AA53A4|nr:hypothetical protein [Modestobacter sp. VKM Ac-2984]MCZ2815818.1 hypothetical protein [Modestobacter sp. VKM Ac-2984]